MQSNGHLGFCVDTNDIAEFKCPYKEAEISIEEACKGFKFCCLMIDGKLHLKRSHGCQQVHLQQYVTSDCSNCCDFCIYTTKNVAAERIYPDKEWVLNICPQLDQYYFDYIPLELVAKQHKPTYFC